MTAHERAWRREFEMTSRAIPSSFLRECEDGFVAILPEYRDNGIVVHYRELCLVGYAKGWL